MIQITAFRAKDNELLTNKYIEGHKKVLELYGVTKVTSADLKWVEDPNSVVIHVESDNGKVLGGGRIQQYNTKNPLPIETAVGELDNKIFGLVEEYSASNTGEFCGLWNSREVAGLGIGSIFLGRVGISLITQLNLQSLLALCSPATLKPCLNIGFVIMKEIGNEGTFYYPKEDLLATALIVPDPILLNHASEIDRERIFELRKNPQQTAQEVGPRGIVEINYNLAL